MQQKNTPIDAVQETFELLVVYLIKLYRHHKREYELYSRPKLEVYY